MNKQYCVYLHKRKTDNIIFYVGIGNKKRPYIKTGRSKFWKNEVLKHDYDIEILSDNLTWENAQEAEIRLIKIYGRKNLKLGTLVNLTDGGDGALNTKPSIESKRKISQKLKKFYSVNKHHSIGKNPYINRINAKSIKIINTETGEIFPSIHSVLKILNVPKTTFLRWLKNPEKNKTVFKYFE